MQRMFQFKLKNITLDKKKNITIFRDDVVIQTDDKYIIKSEYAEYNKLLV